MGNERGIQVIRREFKTHVEYERRRRIKVDCDCEFKWWFKEDLRSKIFVLNLPSNSGNVFLAEWLQKRCYSRLANANVKKPRQATHNNVF